MKHNILFIHGISNQPSPDIYRYRISELLNDIIAKPSVTAIPWSDLFYAEHLPPEATELAEYTQTHRGTSTPDPIDELIQEEYSKFLKDFDELDLNPNASRGIDDAFVRIFTAPLLYVFTSQVISYFKNGNAKFEPTNRRIRDTIFERLDHALHTNTETTIIVAHSMGSVIAYDYLRTHPEKKIHSLITMGSPLGGLTIRSHLRKAHDSPPEYPPNMLHHWFNISARNDLITMPAPSLAEIFTDETYKEKIIDTIIPKISKNPIKCHLAKNYLSSDRFMQALSICLLS